MNKIFLSFSLSATLLLVGGCASTPKKNIMPKYTATDTHVSFEHEKYKDLRLVTKGQTAALVGLKTVMYFLEKKGTTGFSKEQLTGKKITDVKNKNIVISPLYDIKKNIETDLNTMAQANPKLLVKSFREPIEFVSSTPGWKLMYDELLGNNSKYTLAFNAEMKRALNHREESTFFGSKTVSDLEEVSCTYDSKPYTLEEWKANDYTKVVTLKSEIIKECSSKFKVLLPKITAPSTQKELVKIDNKK